MAKLEAYRQKRDFSKTPEPGPDAVRSRKRLSYVVQKHDASHLHYDFRLEFDGVLLSWAVPKGPSLDPSEKRLAMHVEDHPVSYGDFEGVIPEGEYGGGTVMLWDRGEWEPEYEDIGAHLAEGHLKFELRGERLRGRWMLVKTKGYGGRGDRESWLLFKERDEDARARSDFDATAEWQTSVATGRSLEEIAAGEHAVWHSDMTVEENERAIEGKVPRSAPAPVRLKDTPLAVKAPTPRQVEVSLATLVSEAPDGDDWVHEVKFDGYRIVAFLENGKVKLKSRRGNDWTERFPVVAAAVGDLPAKSAVIDGEVVVFRPDGTSDFQALQNHAKAGAPAEPAYMAFDLIYMDGYDLTALPLLERKAWLESIVTTRGETVRYSSHVKGHGPEFYSNACKMNLEGIVSKRADAPYRAGRGRGWLKAKCLQRQEFVVVGWTDPGGARKDFGALVLAVREDGGLRRVGRVGTGFTELSLREIAARLKRLESSNPPVSNPPKGAAARSVHWVRPDLVAEVAFSEWTSEGSLRQPSFLGLREDKQPAEVVREHPVAVESAARETKPVFAGVLLTNPDRVLWPDTGLTKAGLAAYYESVAELMLPHVVDRPLSLVRCPNGYTGECFYQKHIENFPKSVHTVDIFEPQEGKTEPYGTVKDLAGLVGLVQMGVLEIHPWGSRNDDPDKPDRLVFDLDPDPELPYPQVAATALLLRSELTRLGLDSWVKSTGGKGLHVVVPVVRKLDWETAKDFAHAFVDSIVEMEPRLFTSNMSKAKRGGRIFIDYLRNARGATAIAPYSTRARPGATVAVPLHWDEIGEAKEQLVWTVADIAERLSDNAPDPWAGLGKKRQSVTSAMLRRLDVR